MVVGDRFVARTVRRLLGVACFIGVSVVMVVVAVADDELTSSDAAPVRRLPTPTHFAQVAPRPGDNLRALYGGFAYRSETSQPGGVIPAEGATLRATHVLFMFDEIPGAIHYQLQVVIDEGAPDPFINEPVVDLVRRIPRRVVTDGLGFGDDYAWRIRGLDAKGSPDDWQAVRRFTILSLPTALNNAVSVSMKAPQLYQPGLTLIPLRTFPGYGIAVDQTGQVVWFLGLDPWVLRLLRNGNVLYTETGRGGEATLEGVEIWNTGGLPVDFHDIIRMPNGNRMLLVHHTQKVERDGQGETWLAQVLTEVTTAGDVVWTWNPFDHVSTLDFDACIMDGPPPGGAADWFHANAVVYDASDNSIYYSSRHLSRVIKIDYATGEVLWNLGLDKPSGEVDFGHDLFTMQHSPKILHNGNILMFDNGNRRGDSFCEPPNPFSAVVELAVDPAAPEPVAVVWRYEAGVFAPFMGDADRLPNGNTLVTAGPVGLIREVAPDETVVWELSTSGAWLYRSERIPTLYPLRGDDDGDDDVDFADFVGFQRCFSGVDQGEFYHSCLVHDFDEDGDVDIVDYGLFMAAFTGIGD